MSKLAVVYWSGTGNTEEMAQGLAEGIKSAGAEVDLFEAVDFKEDMVERFDAIAFGCPSMGAEELEDSEFEPMFRECESELKKKNVALFGSYDWGDGEWMEEWQEACRLSGLNLVADGLICHQSPEDADLANCETLGQMIAKSVAS